MVTMAVTEARAKVREAIAHVKDGEEIKITQNGEVVAVWLHPSRLRYRARTEAVSEAERLAERLREERNAPFELKRASSQTEADEHIRELREARESRRCA